VGPYPEFAVNTHLLVLIALSAIVLLLFLFLFRLARQFVAAGFTRGEAIAILLAAPVLGLVNIPLSQEGNLVLAVNVGGAIVPLLVTAKLVLENRAPRLRTLVATVVVGLLAYRSSSFVADQGIEISWFLPVAASLVAGIVLTFGRLRRAAPLSYASGTLGILIGADLWRLPEVMASQPAHLEVASIGGAGALDAVFLVGVFAVLLALLLWSFGRGR
jgi:uncharacterized membrane protein